MIIDKLIKGELLVSEPTSDTDATFNRSVILLADYTKKGSVGFILNKPSNYFLNDLIPEIAAQFKIYNGGPIEQDSLYFIHNVPKLISNSIEISSGIYWGGDFDSIKTLINSNKVKEENIRFFLGYTGWGENQLESEIKINYWIRVNNHYKNKIIGITTTHFWKEQIMKLGNRYAIWSNAPEDPQCN